MFANVISGMFQQAHEVGTLSPVAGQKMEAQSQRRRAHSPLRDVSSSDAEAPSMEGHAESKRRPLNTYLNGSLGRQ